MPPKLELRDLLADLAASDTDFVVIGSSALAIQGWEIAPGDLDLLSRAGEVAELQRRLGVEEGQGRWVTDGDARRFECQTPLGAVDIYVEVSGGLGFAEVSREAKEVQVGTRRGSVRAASPEHVRNMRAAVGRSTVPAGTPLSAELTKDDAPHVVAIDGPAGAGKSTVARAVARELGFTYLDTGAMYRSVTLAVFERQADTDDHVAIGLIANSIEISFEGERVFLDGRDVTTAIRAPGVTAATPHVAAYPEVREAMMRNQRRLFASAAFVAEGRDVTTVVAPDAPLKIYLTASLEERARRRAQESGESVATVLEALEERDRLDEGRTLSALRVADDALTIDTTGRQIEDVVSEIARLARERCVA